MVAPAVNACLVATYIGEVTVPVNVGEAKGAFKAKSTFVAFASNAVCVAVETGFSKSVVLFTFSKPTIAAVTPYTVPVNVGETKGAFKAISALVAFAFNAVCVAVETGLSASAVLLALPKPISVLVKVTEPSKPFTL